MSWCSKVLSRLRKVNSFPFPVRSFNDNRLPDDIESELAKKAIPAVSELLENDILSVSKSKTDPDDTTALFFPGQGSQFVGMVDDLLGFPNVKDMFNVASDILRFDLLHYCQHGPQEELDKTVHCQPAIMVTSLAGVEKIQAIAPDVLEKCVAAAGYSIGEYAALVFAGVLTFEDAIRLVQVRSQSMQRACNMVDSKMITAVGGANTRFKLTCEEARDYCVQEHAMEDPVCYVSAYLCPNVVTIAGHAEAIKYIQDNIRKHRINKIFPIPVSGAFHTQLMSQAALDLKAAVKNVSIQQPLIEVYSNVTGKKYENVSSIRQHLPIQVVRPVKWEQIIHNFLARPAKVNMPNIYEVGPGKQLGTLLRRCNGKGYQKYLNISSL